MNPQGKIVIITGASSGIGAAAAGAFAAAGADVVLAARNEVKLQTIASKLPGRPLVVPTDVADQAAVARLAETIIAERGRIDIVVNNAGIGLAAPVAELRAEDFERAVAVDVLGPIWLTQAVLPHMRARRRGQLLFVSSVVGLRALPYLGGYAAAKAALDRLTESLRVELAGSGIAVTLMRPGTTSTGFTDNRLGSGREQRRVNAHAATSEQVAAALVRAAEREPRVAYVSWRDRLTIAVSLVAPRLTDTLLGRSFSWNGRPDDENVI